MLINQARDLAEAFDRDFKKQVARRNETLNSFLRDVSWIRPVLFGITIHEITLRSGGALPPRLSTSLPVTLTNI